MPEGDTIHRLAARIAKALVGGRVTAFEAHRIDDEVARSVVGRSVASVEARGKNLLVFFDDGRALHVHLRMLGRLRVERPRSSFWRPAPARPELRLATTRAAVVGSRLPLVRLYRPGGARRSPDLAGLGPDLVRADFDEDEAVRRLRALDRPVGEALMVQRALAGIGNVYKSEVLFLERTDPRAPSSALSEEHARRLVRRASALLRRNLGPGPRTTRPSLGGERLWVYRRRGEPCFRCGADVAMIRQGAAPGRTTYYCPRCQSDEPHE